MVYSIFLSFGVRHRRMWAGDYTGLDGNLDIGVEWGFMQVLSLVHGDVTIVLYSMVWGIPWQIDFRSRNVVRLRYFKIQIQVRCTT